MTTLYIHTYTSSSLIHSHNTQQEAIRQLELLKATGQGNPDDINSTLGTYKWELARMFIKRYEKVEGGLGGRYVHEIDR